MPPFVDKESIQAQDPLEKLVAPQAGPWKYEIVYKAVLGFGYVHLAAMYGLYLAVTATKRYTLFFCTFTAVAAGIGVTAGAHRLWSHRAYNLPLQILLMIMHSMAFQYSVLTWVKDHRMPHRYTSLFSFTFCYILPTVIPIYFWGESLNVAYNVTMLRYAYSLHAAFLINSFAHIFGSRTYDKSISPK